MTILLRVVERVALEEMVSILSEQGYQEIRDCVAKWIWCHVPKVFRKQIRGFHDLLRQNFHLHSYVRVEFNLNGFLNNVINVSGFCGEDGGMVVNKVDGSLL
jgi:hypothetical protein